MIIYAAPGGATSPLFIPTVNIGVTFIFGGQLQLAISEIISFYWYSAIIPQSSLLNPRNLKNI